MLRAGDCLWIETNTDRDGNYIRHLHIILTDPLPSDTTTIIVCIETLNSPRQDRTVLLKAGDPPAVTHESYVNYKRARIAAIKDLETLISRRHASKVKPASPAVLIRVRKGILDSDFTPEEVRQRYLDDLAAMMT
jgi:hypothetical protein